MQKSKQKPKTKRRNRNSDFPIEKKQNYKFTDDDCKIAIRNIKTQRKDIKDNLGKNAYVYYDPVDDPKWKGKIDPGIWITIYKSDPKEDVPFSPSKGSEHYSIPSLVSLKNKKSVLQVRKELLQKMNCGCNSCNTNKKSSRKK